MGSNPSQGTPLGALAEVVVGALMEQLGQESIFVEVARKSAEHRERVLHNLERLGERNQRDEEMLEALKVIDVPAIRAVVDLHSNDGVGLCNGCDYGGYEGEPGGWPCRTVIAVAKVYGIPTRKDL